MHSVMENSYAFRIKVNEVHRPHRRNPELTPAENECAIDGNWSISIPAEEPPDPVLLTAARDLQHYFVTSMDLSPAIRKERGDGREIRLEPAEDSGKTGAAGRFVLEVEPGMIKVTGRSGRDIFAGTIYMEDQMNLREAPFLPIGRTDCDPLIKSRGVHSGFGLDVFPDDHLNAIAHAGFTEIYLFVRGPGKCANSCCDIQDLIDRAEKYGLDVMFYSYIPGYKHPDEPDAREYFEHHFGTMFKLYPKAKGITLVGESAQFPSKDPATTGKRWTESIWNGIPDSRPAPGWWPCRDYPDWIKAVQKAIQKYKPDAVITFSTYNWLWTPAEVRRKFLEDLPKDVQVRIPFEMFKTIDLGHGVCRQVMDYTISETDFGQNCLEEMEMAHRIGLSIGVTSLTGGTPWNFGTTPYVPAPFQWIKKFRSLQAAKKKYGADNFYDSHHMGWWPSIVTDLGRAAFRQPETNLEELLLKLTRRDYGMRAAERVMEVWRLWSEAMTFYVASNENQYGPFRVGPSYPLVFHANVTRTMGSKEIEFPSMENAFFGGKILKTYFHPFENSGQSPYALRCGPEMTAQKRMLELWRSGVRTLEQAGRLIPANRTDNYTELLGLGKFIECFIITGINVNLWYQKNLQLLNTHDRDGSLRLLDELEKLAEEEIRNAQNAIPLVEANSRFGWEPSMEYMTNRWHLEWKIKQVRSMIDGDIAAYRKMLGVEPCVTR